MSTNTKQQYIEQVLQSGEQMGIESVSFHAVAAEKAGLNLSDMKAVGLLLKAGPLAANDIGRQLNLTPGAVTTMVDRLTAQGFVYRRKHPQDGRKVVVQLNAHKVAQAQALYLPMIEDMTKLLGTFTLPELQTILRYQQQAAELMRQQALELQITKPSLSE